MEKFYDSVDLCILAEELIEHEYPSELPWHSSACCAKNSQSWHLHLGTDCLDGQLDASRMPASGLLRERLALDIGRSARARAAEEPGLGTRRRPGAAHHGSQLERAKN